MSAARILVVDDDPHLREVVRYALSRQGWEVLECEDGATAVEIAKKEALDCVVLDVMMPELDGLEACRLIRAFSTVPILFLSSRAEEVDKVLGLELGGDDYLAKPFSTRELASRVKAMLRRARPAPATAPAQLTWGRVRMDPESFRAYVDDHEMDLTATEFRLLAALLRHPTRVYTREELIERAYTDSRFVSDRTMDSHLRNVRSKLRDLGVDPIETVHGVGYRLRQEGA
jgi:two-component system OmpR family response regulator